MPIVARHRRPAPNPILYSLGIQATATAIAWILVAIQPDRTSLLFALLWTAVLTITAIAPRIMFAHNLRRMRRQLDIPDHYSNTAKV